LKYVGSGFSLVIQAGYKEGYHEIHVEGVKKGAQSGPMGKIDNKPLF
jgi:hypothetical protein